MSSTRWLFKAKSKTEYRTLENLIDSFKENAKIVAYSNDKFYFVAEIYSSKVIDNIRSRGLYILEKERDVLQ